MPSRGLVISLPSYDKESNEYSANSSMEVVNNHADWSFVGKKPFGVLLLALMVSGKEDRKKGKWLTGTTNCLYWFVMWNSPMFWRGRLRGDMRSSNSIIIVSISAPSSHDCNWHCSCSIRI